MTHRKKILFVLAGLLLILMILIFSGILNLQYQDNEVDSNSNASWSGKSSSSTMGDVQDVKTEFKVADLSLVVLLGKDTLYKEINKLSPVVLTIDSYKVGPLWMPLYKSADFSAIGSVKIDRNVKTTLGPGMAKSSKFNLSGELTTSGRVVLKGFYSHKEASKLVQDLVVQNFVAKAKEHFSTFSPEYLQDFVVTQLADTPKVGPRLNVNPEL